MQRREFVAGLVTAIAVTSAFQRPVSAQNEPRVHVVQIHNFVFAPETVTARPGDTIRWTNRDIVPHTATADDESWDTGTLKTGESADIVVKKDMAVTYFCRFHPMMKAKLHMA